MVTLSGVKSDLLNIDAGVPQGSILGPLLFLVYINDIVVDIDATINLFADDTSLYLIVDSPITCSNILNKDLETINSWANKRLVNFNANKTESILFSRKLHKPIHPPLFLNNTTISEVQQHKHLGLTFSNNGTWKDHITIIKEKAWSRINIMRKFKFKLNRQALQTICFSFIRLSL